MKSIMVAPLGLLLLVAACAVDEAERPDRGDGAAPTAGASGTGGSRDASQEVSGGAAGTGLPSDGTAPAESSDTAAGGSAGELEAAAGSGGSAGSPEAMPEAAGGASGAGPIDASRPEAAADVGGQDGRVVDASADRAPEAAGPVDAAPDATLCSNTAIRFNGGVAYGNINRPVQDDFTIEAWFRTNTSLPGSNFFEGSGLVYGDVGGQSNDFALSIVGQRLAFNIGNPDTLLTSTVIVTTDLWTHVAVIRQRAPSRMAIYINGVLDRETVAANVNSLNAAGMLTIGANLVNMHYYSGYLDEVRFWGVVRTPAQIVATMRTRLVGNEAGLAAYYRFDTPATTLTLMADSSGGGRNGVITGTVTLPPSDAPIFCP